MAKFPSLNAKKVRVLLQFLKIDMGHHVDWMETQNGL